MLTDNQHIGVCFSFVMIQQYVENMHRLLLIFPAILACSQSESTIHKSHSEILSSCNINDYAASVKVYALIKPAPVKPS